jgi:hypothetical protein
MPLPAMAPRFPELQDGGWLRRKYEAEGLSSYAIAAELGCRPPTVSRALRHHGIAARMGRPAVVGPGQVYGRLTVLGGAARADPGRPSLSLPLRMRARDRRAGRRTPTGKGPLLRLPARRGKAERPHPATERAQQRTLRTAGGAARGRASEHKRRQDVQLPVRLWQHDDRARRQPHQRPHPFVRMPARGVPPARRPGAPNRCRFRLKPGLAERPGLGEEGASAAECSLRGAGNRGGRGARGG